MFNLAVKRILKKEKRLRIVILGLNNAGKTSILQRFLGREIEEIPPTYGYQIIPYKHTYLNEEYAIEFLDIGGQESIRAYWDTYYAGADGVLFVYDISGSAEYKKVLSATISHPTLRNASVICAANKADEHMEEEPDKVITCAIREVEEVRFDYLSYASSNNHPEEMEKEAYNALCASDKKKEIPIMHTSAKTGKSVKRVFFSLIKDILERKENAIL
ncbi:ADP-ribosylation factor-like protein 2 [Nematocida sp. LUAm3]|nr:ADP-ribosylation factor-like protein 2 [Nematocida sp. LUAm3]